LPTDFGFPIDVHAHEPDTIYVVPIKSDSEHYPPRESCACTAAGRADTSGRHSRKVCRNATATFNVLRDAMAVDSLDSCGVYFGTTGGQVYASADAGDSWAPIVPRSSGRGVRRSPDAAVIRVVLRRICGRWRSRRRGEARRRGSGQPNARSSSARGLLSDAAWDDRDHVTQQRRAFVRFFACEQDLSHEPPDAPLPDAVAMGVEPFLVVGAMAGGLG